MEDVTDIIIQTAHPQLICSSVMLVRAVHSFPIPVWCSLQDLCKHFTCKGFSSNCAESSCGLWGRTRCHQGSHACPVPEFLNSPFSMSKAGITISSLPRKWDFVESESHFVPPNSLPFMLLGHVAICDHQRLPVSFGGALQGIQTEYLKKLVLCNVH